MCCHIPLKRRHRCRAVLLPAVLLAVAALGPLLAGSLAEAGFRHRAALLPTQHATARDLVQEQLAAAVFAAAPALASTPVLPTVIWLRDQLILAAAGGPLTSLSVTHGPARFDSLGSTPSADAPLRGGRPQLTASLTLPTSAGPLERDLTLWSWPASAWALAGAVLWDPAWVEVSATGPVLLSTAPNHRPWPALSATSPLWAYDDTGRPVAPPAWPISPGWRWLAPGSLAEDPTPGAVEADGVVIDLPASLATPVAWPPLSRVLGTWRVGGQEGAFGGDPAAHLPIPFAGLRVTGEASPRLHVDLGAWDGPSRLHVAGDTGLVMVTGSHQGQLMPLRLTLDQLGPMSIFQGPNLRPLLLVAASVRLAGPSPWHAFMLLDGVLQLDPEVADGTCEVHGTIAGPIALEPALGAGRPHLQVIANPDLGESLRRFGLHLPSWILATLE